MWGGRRPSDSHCCSQATEGAANFAASASAAGPPALTGTQDPTRFSPNLGLQLPCAANQSKVEREATQN